MINVIFNEINYDDTKFRKLKYEEYLALIKWGRKYPTRFVEKILDIQLTDHQKYIFLSMWNAESICILASRSSGKSFIIAVYIMARSILYPNHDTCIIAPDWKHRQSAYTVMCLKINPFNCWNTLKIIKLKRKDEICLNVNVTKVKKINYMNIWLNPKYSMD